MTELNAIIGVSSLFNLSVIICFSLTRKHDQWQCAVDIEFSHNYSSTSRMKTAEPEFYIFYHFKKRTVNKNVDKYRLEEIAKEMINRRI